MQFNRKQYQKEKTICTLKKNNFLIFAINANQNSENWKYLEQSLHKLSLAYTKNSNNTTIKTLQKSIFKNFKNLVNSTFFFLNPNKKTIKNDIINSLNLTQFTILTIKLNKKIYAVTQLKKTNTIKYKKSMKIIQQFCKTALKVTIKTQNNVI